MALALVALIAWLVPPQAVQSVAPLTPLTDEEQVRSAVQQYYEALAARDPDKALTYWSPAANPRPMRETFLALFGDAGQDQYTVDVRSVTITGTAARVRVFNLKTHVSMNSENRPVTTRVSNLNLQLWKKEPAGWKLTHDGPLAEELADQFIPASADARKQLIEENRGDLNALRYVLAMRGSMAVNIQQNYEQARTLFMLALDVARAAGDRRGESDALNNIANAYSFLGNFPLAIDYHQQRIALAREMDDQSSIAASTYGLGDLAYRRAEYTPALGFYRDALALYEKAEDAASTGRTLTAVGNVQYLQGEYDAAYASYRRALTILEAVPDRSGAAFPKKGLARVLAAQGDLAAALDIYGRVLADAREDLQRDPRMWSNVGTTLESIGELHYRLGNTDRARATFDEARRMFEKSPLDSGRVYAALGMVELVAGRFDAALSAYTESRTRNETARNNEGVARAWVGIGFSQTARQKFADAVTAYRTAIGMYEQQNHEEDAARAWLGMSMAQSGAGDEPTALESAEKVRAIAQHLKNEDLAWRGAVRAGEALRKLKRLDDARQTFTAAIASIDRLSADAPISVDARGQLEDSATAWTGLAVTLANQGDAAGALAAAEARRAHIRRVQFASFHRDITRGETDDERTDEQMLVREIVSARAQLRAESQGGHPDAARMRRLNEQLTALQAKRADQQARLYARLPALSELRAISAPALDPQALNALGGGPRSVLVEYVVGDDEILALTVVPGDAQPDIAATTTPFDRHGFAEALAKAMERPALQDAGEWRTRATPLAAVLLAPIAARLAGRDTCVIVPDDLLWKVPFEALPHKDGDLAASLAVTYATSLTTLRMQRAAAAPAADAASTRAAAPSAFLAAPAIPAGIRTQLSFTIPDWTAPDPQASLEAARSSAAVYGDAVAVRSGADATESAARELLSGAAVVHIAAPLLVSATAPLLSSIILASSGDTPAEDGRWEAREWFGSSSRTRIAVVPDGFAFGAAGVGGAMDALAWAAAASGVPALVLGRWPADGFVTTDLAAALHGQLAKGLPPPDAWRAAVRAARAKSTAPAAWAGLRFIGPGF